MLGANCEAQKPVAAIRLPETHTALKPNLSTSLPATGPEIIPQVVFYIYLNLITVSVGLGSGSKKCTAFITR
jgi:hypothetical protein